MPARRDTRCEAARVRRLSPLQTVADQSQVWGIRCHSCTWREGFAPSWQTELQGSSFEFIPIRLQMHTGPSESCIMAEALETSVSLSVGGPASLNRDNLKRYTDELRQAL